jgi:NhaA family Na+:H+ antiporter
MSNDDAATGPRRYFVAGRIVRPIQQFIDTEVFSGAVLLAAALAALVWANSPWNDSYFDFIHTEIVVDIGVFRFDEDLQHAISDGLMTLFFFVVGLEMKRELWRGELSGLKRAALPAVAALGGMVVPAAIFIALNAGTSGADGWGIPMATDIAFALGILALVGRRIPAQVRVFLLALAIVDDIGAILVIAVFYSGPVEMEALLLAIVLIAAVYTMNRFGVRGFGPYVAAGLLLWAAIYESGVHATIAGVVLGLMTPLDPYYSPAGFHSAMGSLLARFRAAQDEGDVESLGQVLNQMETATEGTESPLERLEHNLHPWTSYLVVPLFALVNAGIVVNSDLIDSSLSSSVTAGVLMGLVFGKPAGILLFSWLAVRIGLATLPENTRWTHVLGVGIVAGVGFTVALLINELAFTDAALVGEGKIGVLCASLVAGLAGLGFLLALRPAPESEPD